VLVGGNKEMPSVRAKMVSGLFKMLGVNKMLDKQGEEFDKLLEKYKAKQKKPLKVPYKKMKDFNIDTESINGTTCYVISKKGAASKNAALYLFGGGYILPPDPGDIILCGQMAENCDAKVWFPLYPMAPEHRLVETLQNITGISKYVRGI
jgi:acetyl esterase/lipase